MGAPDDPALAAVAEQLARLRADHARLLERVGAAEERFRLISRGVVRVQEAERGRISRELHDGVGQSLTALKLQLALLGQDAAAAPLAERLADLRGLVDRTLQEVRHACHALRPQMLDELGLPPTLRWLTRTFQERTGIAVDLSADALPARLDPEVETLAYRVVQEALTNAARHARAGRVSVDAGVARGRLTISVRDDGAGFDAASVLSSTEEDRGFGVRGMRDRVRLLGGRFVLRSTPGQGATVEVDVPLAAGTEG